MGRKKKARYMQMDLDYWRSPFVILMQRKFGWLGACAFPIVNCEIMRASSLHVNKEEILALQTDETWPAIIQALIERGWLTEQDGRLTSEGAQADMADLEAQSSRGKRGADARWHPEGMQNGCGSNAQAMHKQCGTDADGMRNGCESDADGMESPSLYITPSSYGSDLGKGFKGKTIIIYPEEFAGLLVNSFHGDEAKCRDMCAAADENATAKSMSFRDSVASAAYVQGWLRKSKQFERPKPPDAESEIKKWARSKGVAV
jgi:hypothetical protein